MANKTSFLAKQEKLLKNRIADLEEQFEASSKQLNATLDDADKKVLKNKKSNLKKEIEEEYDELAKIQQQLSKNNKNNNEKVSPEPTHVTHGDDFITDVKTTEIKEVHSLSYDPLQSETAQFLGLPTFFKDKLKVGGYGPQMAVILAGRFLMGSSETEQGRETHEEHQSA
jgi:formylglycine-generating enzyme required for sulfatase activity